MHPAVPIVSTAAAIQIEKLARDIGRIDAACILILDLVQAAFAATVAQSLPLIAGERFDWLLPERDLTQFSAPTWRALRPPA